jgi:hypothetical protein
LSKKKNQWALPAFATFCGALGVPGCVFVALEPSFWRLRDCVWALWATFKQFVCVHFQKKIANGWPLLPGLSSASLGRSKSLLWLARPRWGARNGRSSLLGFAGASEIAAQACSVGLAGALDSAAQAHSDGETCEKLFENAVLGSRLALNTWLCSSMLRAWICSGPR